MKKKLLNALNIASSKKFALAIILLISLAVTAEMVILLSHWDSSVPIAKQTGIIYRSLWFQGLCLLLLINLTICTLRNAFRRLRYRQGLNLWGSTIFHVGLILIIAGCLLSANWRMVGTMNLILGETKYDSPGQYKELVKSRFFRDDDFRNFGMTATKLDTELDDENRIKLRRAFIKIQDGKSTSLHRAETQEQFAYGNCYIYIQDVNYVLRFRLITSTVTREATIPLEYYKWGEGIITMDRRPFRINPLSHHFSAELIPNLSKDKNLIPNTSRFLQLENPAVTITVKAANDQTKVLAEQLLRPGETMNIDGSKLTFLNAKPFALISVVYDPGAKLVFAGMALAVAGLSIFYLYKQPRGISSINPMRRNVIKGDM